MKTSALTAFEHAVSGKMKSVLHGVQKILSVFTDKNDASAHRRHMDELKLGAGLFIAGAGILEDNFATAAGGIISVEEAAADLLQTQAGHKRHARREPRRH